MLILKRTRPRLEKYKHISHNSFDDFKMSMETHFPFSKQTVAVFFLSCAKEWPQSSLCLWYQFLLAHISFDTFHGLPFYNITYINDHQLRSFSS